MGIITKTNTQEGAVTRMELSCDDCDELQVLMNPANHKEVIKFQERYARHNCAGLDKELAEINKLSIGILKD